MSSKGCHEVRGKTVGIVGYGHVGSQVSVLAEALGMRVVFFDIQEKVRSLPPLFELPAAALHAWFLVTSLRCRWATPLLRPRWTTCCVGRTS
jgi:lactate dehydrogenase-like 2-hydroxyacid dehydrogenase